MFAPPVWICQTISAPLSTRTLIDSLSYPIRRISRHRPSGEGDLRPVGLTQTSEPCDNSHRFSFSLGTRIQSCVADSKSVSVNSRREPDSILLHVCPIDLLGHCSPRSNRFWSCSFLIVRIMWRRAPAEDLQCRLTRLWGLLHIASAAVRLVDPTIN